MHAVSDTKMIIQISESEITGGHLPLSVHVRTMTEQITACKDIMAVMFVECEYSQDC